MLEPTWANVVKMINIRNSGVERTIHFKIAFATACASPTWVGFPGPFPSWRLTIQIRIRANMFLSSNQHRYSHRTLVRSSCVRQFAGIARVLCCACTTQLFSWSDATTSLGTFSMLCPDISILVAFPAETQPYVMFGGYLVWQRPRPIICSRELTQHAPIRECMAQNLEPWDKATTVVRPGSPRRSRMTSSRKRASRGYSDSWLKSTLYLAFGCFVRRGHPRKHLVGPISSVELALCSWHEQAAIQLASSSSSIAAKTRHAG